MPSDGCELVVETYWQLERQLTLDRRAGGQAGRGWECGSDGPLLADISVVRVNQVSSTRSASDGESRLVPAGFEALFEGGDNISKQYGSVNNSKMDSYT
jgi:hypothetical protein